MRWNDLSLEYDNNGDSYLTHTLGVHLFRLRKWMRKHNVEEFQPRKVKEEFSAARIMSSIPAFGEKFYFVSLSVTRLSGQVDVIPISISERLMDIS